MFILIFLAFLLVPNTVLANDDICNKQSPLYTKGTVNLRIDNDMFGGLGQDQGYSNGFLVSWVSPNLVHYVGDDCLPSPIQYLNNKLSMLHPEGFDEQNMTLGIGQMMYTPSNRKRKDVIKNDRPYAGALMFSVGYNARKDSHLRTTQLRFGMVGPAAQADNAQNSWHDIIGVDRFHGWGNQLKNEPAFQLIHERRNRSIRQERSNGWGWDITNHWGASLGNFATYANIGSEFRIGYRLPDDFGTAPLRPAGENTAPLHTPRTNGWNGHLFVALDGRWMLRDITLDGNTFRTSHSVKKRPFVADVGYGFAFYNGNWRVALARYHRTKEFHGQKESPVYGTITLSRRF